MATGMATGVATGSMAARGLMRQIAPPHLFSDKEKRDAAFGLIQNFSRFAEVSCGSTAPSNRANVRRAVFHATLDIDLAPFVERRLAGDVSAIESVVRMECPVMVPDKTMVEVRLPESAPKRIIFAAKTLRRHYSLSETTTCRSCIKRSRCRFFKTPPLDAMQPGVWHLARVLFGMSQYSRGHLQQPEAYPLYFSPENLDSAHTLIKAIGDHIADEAAVPRYSELERATDESAREIHLREALKKVEKKQAAAEERLLSLPQWMRETLRPVPSKDMSKKQRELLKASGVASGQQDEPSDGQRAFGADELDEWVEEGETPGEFEQPLFDRSEQPTSAHNRKDLEALGDSRPLVSIDHVKDIPIMNRFTHHAPKPEARPMPQFNSVLGGETSGIYKVEGERWAHRIDLDEAAGTGHDLEVEVEKLAATHGGYSIVNLLNSETFKNVPKEALQYVSLAPGALQGVQQYGSAPTPRRLHARVLDQLWKRDETSKDELPFLTRVPFDAGVGRSGASLPPGRLPREKLLGEQERFVPPPRRNNQKAASERGAVKAASKSAGASSSQIVHLDADTSISADVADDGPPDALVDEHVLAADEELAVRALSDKTGLAARLDTPGRRVQAAKESSTPSSAEQEDQRFTSWSARRPPLVPVMEPRIDFKRLSSPSNLDNVLEASAELHVTPRQKSPLPHDETFVSTFRRPLLSSDPSEAESDPLGTAAPGVDIKAIKSEVAASAVKERTTGLDQDGDFVFGGALKFPKFSKIKDVSKLRGASPSSPLKATRQLSPVRGRLRQARVEDLGDLVRPQEPAPGQSLGHLSPPENGADLRDPLNNAERREHENAAIATQMLLNKKIKQTMKKEYASPRAGKTNQSSERRPKKLLDLAGGPSFRRT